MAGWPKFPRMRVYVPYTNAANMRMISPVLPQTQSRPDACIACRSRISWRMRPISRCIAAVVVVDAATGGVPAGLFGSVMWGVLSRRERWCARRPPLVTGDARSRSSPPPGPIVIAAGDAAQPSYFALAM